MTTNNEDASHSGKSARLASMSTMSTYMTRWQKMYTVQDVAIRW